MRRDLGPVLACALVVNGTIGTGIWKLPPDQHSVLNNQLPGLHFQTWSDKEGVHVQLGDKDSLFQIVGASTATQP